MGYDVRLHIVDRRVNELPNGENYAWGDSIAKYDLCGIGYNFADAFNVPIDFDIYDSAYGDGTRIDCYDDHCCMLKINEVISLLEKFEAEEEYYRRVPPLLALLKGINEKDWNDVRVVRFGW